RDKAGVRPGPRDSRGNGSDVWRQRHAWRLCAWRPEGNAATAVAGALNSGDGMSKPGPLVADFNQSLRIQLFLVMTVEWNLLFLGRGNITLGKSSSARRYRFMRVSRNNMAGAGWPG